MSVVNAWVGATTDSSARVVAKISGTSARLLVADNPSMTGAVASDAVTGSSDDVVSLPITGLDANTRYWWQVEVDSTPDTVTTGQLRTHPTLGEPADFTFAVGNCAAGTTSPGGGTVLAASRLSNHPVFAEIINRDPLFHAHLGDLHYYDLGSGNHGITGGASLANYRRAYDDVLLQDNQHLLYRSVPLVLQWDDHDRGPNDNDRTFSGAEAAATAYRERVPHYPLPHSDGIFQSFQVGRVLFIVDDVRTFRDPNGDAQSPSKTMLGSAQMAWIEQLLTTTSAEFLVFLDAERAFHHPAVESPSGSTDHWGGFTHARSELVNLFGDTGWLDRMLIINGDFHHAGINDGSHEFGGMPIYQFATYDSSGADPDGPAPRQDLWNVGSKSGSGRYGTVRIRDTGTTITVTGTGWAGDVPDLTHSFSVTVDSPAPPPPAPEPVAPVARGEARTRVTWLGCDLVSGRIIAELPEVTGTVSRVLGEPTSASLQMPIPLGGPGAVPLITVAQATEPGRTMVVAVVNAVPMWGGIVLTRKGGTEATLELGCASIEAYLDRRYVGDHSWTLADEASTIAAGLIGDAQTEGIGLTVDAPPTGRLRTRQYADTDDATVLSRLQELADVIDGPEWTIDLDWTDETQTAVAKVVRVRSRIGRDATESVFETRAHSVFDSRGAAEARYTFTEDYTDGRGANHVVATSSGEGEDRPQSTPARDEVLLAAGWPRWERRWSPSSSITSQEVLDEHAAAELARRRKGARVWTLEARWDAYPRLGVDWALGDDIAWRVVGHRHPDGVSGQARVIGWDLDMQASVVRPKLLEVD